MFGFSGAFDMTIRMARGSVPAIDLEGRALSLELDACRNLGLEARWHVTDDAGAGWDRLRGELDDGYPVLLHADVGELDYHDELPHDTRHAIVVTGCDVHAGVAWVTDRFFADPQRCTLTSLAAARASRGWPEPARHGLLRVRRPARLAEPRDAIRRGARAGRRQHAPPAPRPPSARAQRPPRAGPARRRLAAGAAARRPAARPDARGAALPDPRRRDRRSAVPLAAGALRARCRSAARIARARARGARLRRPRGRLAGVRGGPRRQRRRAARTRRRGRASSESARSSTATSRRSSCSSANRTPQPPERSAGTPALGRPTHRETPANHRNARIQARRAVTAH